MTLDILIPFKNVSKTTRLYILLTWIVFIIASWFLGTMGEKHIFPTPINVFSGLSTLYQEGLIIHIFKSLQLCFVSILISVMISMVFAYTSPIPAFKPLSQLITKFRYLPFAGISFFITMLIHDARNMQITIMAIFLTTFLTTSLIAVIKDIPQEEFDHAKTLKCSNFQILLQVVILGRLDYIIESIRQNLAITWMMLVTIESMVIASGGLGFLIKNSDKYMNHGRLIALQIIILLIGLILDWSIDKLRKLLFRYSKI